MGSEVTPCILWVLMPLQVPLTQDRISCRCAGQTEDPVPRTHTRSSLALPLTSTAHRPHAPTQVGVPRRPRTLLWGMWVASRLDAQLSGDCCSKLPPASWVGPHFTSAASHSHGTHLSPFLSKLTARQGWVAERAPQEDTRHQVWGGCPAPTRASSPTSWRLGRVLEQVTSELSWEV